MTHIRTALLVCVAAAAFGTPAISSDLPRTELTVVGTWSGLALHRDFERPFWEERIPEASNGAISVDLTTFDQMGLNGSEVYRLLERGVFNIGGTVAGYTVADAPELEGLSMPMIGTDAEQAHEIANAFRPVLQEIFRERFNSEFLAVVPYPSQVVFCNTEISSLEDLRGKQVRASGRAVGEFLEALGAEATTIGFAEVPGALDRGVVECAITGTLSAYSSGWHEVSSHVLPLSIGGWDPVVFAANLDMWDALDPEVQELIKSELEEHFERPVWDNAGPETQEGVACLTGNADCPRGAPGDLTLVEATDQETDLVRSLMVEQVLPGWAQRVDARWVDRWNETVGGVLDVQLDN